jgi:hypothetical protein
MGKILIILSLLQLDTVLPDNRNLRVSPLSSG